MKLFSSISLVLLATAGLAMGQGGWDSGAPAFTKPHELPVQDLLNMKGADRTAPLSQVDILQQLNKRLPLEAAFKDDSGRDVTLGQYFDGKHPVVLALVYYECPMLCTQILNGLVRATRILPLTPGKDFEVVVISFDAREGPKEAAEKKAAYLKMYGKPETADSWHFLTGNLSNIKSVTDAVGFRYIWDPHTAVFAHASAIYVATPEGKLSKYFMGVEYSAKDLKLGLVDASSNKIGTMVDHVLLYCYHFDPQSAKYTPFALGLLRVAGAFTALSLGAFVLIMLRRESRQKGKQAA